MAYANFVLRGYWRFRIKRILKSFLGCILNQADYVLSHIAFFKFYLAYQSIQFNIISKSGKGVLTL